VCLGKFSYLAEVHFNKVLMPGILDRGETTLIALLGSRLDSFLKVSCKGFQIT